MAGWTMDGRALDAQRSSSADLDLRGPSRFVAPQLGREWSVFDVSRARRPARPLRSRNGVHASGTDAGYRVSIRRLLGIPAGLAVCTDEPLWNARRFPRLCRRLPWRRAGPAVGL